MKIKVTTFYIHFLYLFHPILVDNQKLQKIRKIVSPEVNYNKVKFRDEIYSIGDYLMIREENDGFLVGKLVKIVQSGGIKKYPYWPTIQVQW